MTRLERQLDPGRFVRIHHSAIVHIDRGRELVTDLHSDFSVGTRLALSRTYRPKLEQALGRELCMANDECRMTTECRMVNAIIRA